MENKASLVSSAIALVVVVAVAFFVFGPGKTKKQVLNLPDFDKAIATNGVLQSSEYLEKTKGKKKELEVFISFKTPVLNTGRETDTLNKIKNRFSKDYKKIKVSLVHDTSGSYMTRDYELKDGKFEEVK